MPNGGMNKKNPQQSFKNENYYQRSKQVEKEGEKETRFGNYKINTLISKA